MNIRKTRMAAFAIALAFLAALIPVTKSEAAGAEAISVTWYNNDFTVIDTSKGPNSTGLASYTTLYDAINDIGNGEYAMVVMTALSRGDNTSVTIRNSATIRLSAESAVTTFLGNMILDNASAKLTISNFNLSASGTGINVRNGTLELDTGARIIGTSSGVSNTKGTVLFGGGQVSSYNPSSTATTVGAPSIISSTDTPSPTATPNSTAVTGVTISPGSATMTKGTTRQLSANVLPSNAANQKVRWWSSDSSVVTVSSSGLVRAVGTGGAFVRVTTVDGEYSSFADIIVTGANVSVTGIRSLNRTTTVAVGSTTSLSTSVLPSNATNKNIRWTSSNSNATVSSSGVVKGVKAGTAVVRAVAEDGGFSTSTTVTVQTAAAAKVAVSTDIARNTRLRLNGSSIGGSVARSSTYVAIEPKSYNEVQDNTASVEVRAFNRLPEDGYSVMRYRIRPIMADLQTNMARGMGDSERLEIGFRRLTSNTMSSKMNSSWRSYSSKNISGPWEVSVNSNEDDMTLRIRLSKMINKSNIQVLKWNGTSFTRMSTSNYAVTRIGEQYYVRIDNATDGVYAVCYR